MKEKKSIRLDKNLLAKVEKFKLENDIAFSNVIEIALIDFFKKNKASPKKIKSKKLTGNPNKRKTISFVIGEDIFENIQLQADFFGVSISNYLRFCLSIITDKDSPIFTPLEMSELRRFRRESSSLGNLLNQALKNKYYMDKNDLLKILSVNRKITKALQNLIKISNFRNLHIKENI